MKDINEIKNTSGLKIISEGEDGLAGNVYTKVSYKNGKPKFENELFFIFSTGCGFEHLSVSTPKKLYSQLKNKEYKNEI